MFRLRREGQEVDDPTAYGSQHFENPKVDLDKVLRNISSAGCWARLWILQELVMAKHAAHVPWRDL